MAGRRIVAAIAGAGLISAFVSGTLSVPGFDLRAAQASCITWQGGQNCDSPAPRATYHYQPPVRSGGGVRYYGGGGGGSRAGAALGAASAAIGILGMLIDAAQQEQENAANEEQRQAYNACQGRYRQAHAINEQARAVSANGDSAEAYAMFERALNTLGGCGSRADLAKLRQNLDNVRTEYARLSNPSSQWKGDDRTNAPTKQVVYPGALEDQANQQCTFATAGSEAWQACVARAKAERIMSTDADIRAACQSIADTDTRNQCVFNRYWAGIQGKDPNQFGDPSNCYWDEHGKPCHPGAVASRTPASNADDDPNSLRNQLRRALAERPKGTSAVEDARAAEIARAKMVRDSLPEGSPDRKTLDDAIAKAEAGQVPNGGAPPSGEAAAAPQPGGEQQVAATPAEPSPGKSSGDDAYENYMNSGNANSGGKNNGDLSRADRFSSPGSDNDREIKRLMGQ